MAVLRACGAGRGAVQRLLLGAVLCPVPAAVVGILLDAWSSVPRSPTWPRAMPLCRSRPPESRCWPPWPDLGLPLDSPSSGWRSGRPRAGCHWSGSPRGRITRRRALGEALAERCAGDGRGGGGGGWRPGRNGSTLESTWHDPAGDGQLASGPGEALVDRTELGPRAAGVTALATLAHITEPTSWTPPRRHVSASWIASGRRSSRRSGPRKP